MAGAEEGKKRMATLVGCNYPNTKNELRGCINDVLAMKDLLVDRFGFDPADVVVLTDDPASSLLPTGANIRGELRRMVDRAAPGDVLFFHYSGHGTLIPAVKPHRGRRRRRDEAIVPCDFNLITDVDFRELVDRLPGGALFTMVSDSCHSGGLIDKEKEQIGPSSASATSASHSLRRRQKTIPFDSVLQHLTSLSGISSPHVGTHLSAVFGADVSRSFVAGKKLQRIPVANDDAILLSGCQADETSADMSPEEAEGKKAYGAFSQALQVALGKAKRGMTMSNRQLVLRARELLGAQGFEQHPCLYCSDGNADAPFLWDYRRSRQRRAFMLN